MKGNELDIQYVASLVVRARQNDSDAFAELYALTYNKVYNYSRHYLRNDFIAQDALQEIYILALKNLHKLNDPTLFIAWLNRISFNVCYDICQKSKHGEFPCYDSDLLETVPDEHLSSNPEARCQKEDEIKQLTNSMNQLPFHEKEVLTMRYFNDMKLEDIADAMNISRSTVKRYIVSGKEHLKIFMKG